MISAEDAIIQEARERFSQVVEIEKEDRERARKCLMFVAGKQWEADASSAQNLKERIQTGRPHIVENHLSNTVSQVVNQQRQARPAAKVSPVADADEDDADVMQGIVRHIEYASGADAAYDCAFEGAAACGRGAWRYTTRYVDDESDDQEIVIQRISDHLSVYVDPDAQEPDLSDMRWCLIVSKMSRDEFKRRWPKAALTSAGFYDGQRNPAPDWINGSDIQIAEYWRLETTKRKNKKGREVEDTKVVQRIINGVETLEQTDWLGKWIPVCQLWGQEVWIEGKRNTYAVIAHSLDSQQLLNYYRSIEAEAIALCPRPKWVGAIGSFKTKSADWANANRLNVAYLEYDPVVGSNGQLAEAPHWEAFDPPIQALSIGAEQAIQGIQSTSGIFDPSLGKAQGKDQSGEAIKSLQQEGNESNFHFMDNLTRVMRHGTRITIDLIQKLYKTAQEIRILGVDMTQEIVMVNAPTVTKKGVAKTYQLDKGTYDVTVSVGPSYQTQRQEAFAHLSETFQAEPSMFAAFADLYFKLADWGPIGDVMSKRAHAMLPPQIAALDKDASQQVPPQFQAQMQQTMQQNEQLQQAVHALSQKLEAKMPELASREKIAALQEQTKINIENAKIAAQIAIAKINASLDKDKQAGDHLIEMMENAHEAAMQAQDQSHQADMSAQDQQHQADMQQDSQGFQAQQSAQQQQADQQQPDASS